MNDWTLPGLLGKFRSEAACRAWFEAARWPDGVRCPRCSSELVHRLSTRPSQFNCRDCRYRFSVTSGTPLHGTHLPLRIWLLAMDLMATSTHGISARRLSLWLGIGYRSAWHLAHLNRYLAEIAYRWNRRRVSAEERLLGLLAGMATGPLTFAECVR